jgi:cytochrome c
VRRLVVALLLFAASLAHAGPPLPEIRVLVFSRTAAFRHQSIPAAVSALRGLALAAGWQLDATEDPAVFTDPGLAPYDAVVFLHTTGDVLDAAQQGALERFVRGRRGWVGIHSAADTEYDWPWYGGLVGAYFSSHPTPQAATLLVPDRAHPAGRALAPRSTRAEEWYDFRASPRGAVHVIATVDERSYTGGAMGADHPIAWCHEYDGGRAFYTALGHDVSAWADAALLGHVRAAVEWAAGRIPGDCSATVAGAFVRVPLVADVVAPMSLDIAPDGRVFFVQITGEVRVHDPATGVTREVAALDVYTAGENGLLGIALDPGFAENGWVYLYYSPPAESGQRLSRFALDGDALDLGSERVLLRVPELRVSGLECCHHAGAIRFDGAGNLLVSTGDNTWPFDYAFATTDERPGHAYGDSQKSAANTNDLRGKLLRIHPESDGGYTIPVGNLFAADSLHRAEIYAMGFKNPFRFAVDAQRGWVILGDVGPDAREDSAADGPRGYDEIELIAAPGNFGWPYCVGDNYAYREHDYATGDTGPFYDCDAPVNDSPNNGGARLLPPAQPAWIWYPHADSPHFPELDYPADLGSTAMGGPVYRAAGRAETGFPTYFDGAVFIYDWSRGWIRAVHVEGDGAIVKIDPPLGGAPFSRPVDMKFAPDGTLYLLEFGESWEGTGPHAGLSRIEYAVNARSPRARATAQPAAGATPLAVAFSSAGSSDPNDDPLEFEWDFQSDGTVDSNAAAPSFTYTQPGVYLATLRARDPDGNVATATVRVVAGNAPPAVRIDAPANGAVFDWDACVPFAARVDDAEDGSSAGDAALCARVGIEPALGHNTHAHPLTPQTGCAGAFRAVAVGGDDPATEDLYYTLRASYADRGAAGGIPSLTGSASLVLQPRRKQAAHATPHAGAISIAPLNLRGVTGVRYRVAATSGGRITARLDAPDGPALGAPAVAAAAGEVEAPLADPGGTHEVFFVLEGVALDWLEFVGPGISTDCVPATTDGGCDCRVGGRGASPWLLAPLLLVLTLRCRRTPCARSPRSRRAGS